MKAHSDKLIGPGGIKCECCRKGFSIKGLRVKLNRLSRRKEKQNVGKELTELAE